MAKSVPRVTVWHHSAEPRDHKTMTLGTDLPIRTSHLCQILIFLGALTGLWVPNFNLNMHVAYLYIK